MHPSMLSHSQSMPTKQSYSINPVFQSARNTPAWTHCWKRSWAVGYIVSNVPCLPSLGFLSPEA